MQASMRRFDNAPRASAICSMSARVWVRNKLFYDHIDKYNIIVNLYRRERINKFACMDTYPVHNIASLASHTHYTHTHKHYTRPQPITFMPLLYYICTYDI